MTPRSSFFSGLPPILIIIASITAWAHAGLALTGYEIHIDGNKAAEFTWQVISKNPNIALGLLRELAAPVFLLWLGFALLALFAGNARHLRPALGDIRLAFIFNWLSVVWLLARFHSAHFSYSVWTVALEPLTSRALAPALDVIALLWLIAAAATTLKIPKNKNILSASFSYQAIHLLIPFFGLLALTGYGYSQTRQQRHNASTALAKSTTSQTASLNIILIGLDSLRRDIALDATSPLTPRLAAFREHSYIESNVVSPLARTFPAWTTILTGLHPSESGVRDNLVPQNQIPMQHSLAWKLKKHGYRTVYATDETRFSNIGHEFGFDQIIAPRAGVSDYLLGQFGDQPIINFMVQWPISEYWLPSLVGNRAFAQAYKPLRFNRRVINELGAATQQPTFIATHFCTAHWPYRDATTKKDLSQNYSPYSESVRSLDAQFDNYLSELRRQGYINKHSLIIVIADHGESLKPEDDAPSSFRDHSGTSHMPPPPRGGHGNSLLSPAQWQVFALFNGQSTRGNIPIGQSDRLASLEDIAPAILQLAGLGGAKPFGMSLPSLLFSDDPNHNRPRSYVRMETAFLPKGFDPTKPSGEKALRIAMDSFDIMPDGRIAMKPAAVQQAIDSRDFAITDGVNVLGIVKQNLVNRLISLNIPRKEWDIYPLDKEIKNPPPLFMQACADTYMKSRMPTACE